MNRSPACLSFSCERVFNVVRFLAAWLLVAGLPPCSEAAGVSADRGQIELPTYPWSAVKHPYFRGTDKVNIYPYQMLDFLSREQSKRTYRTVVLENEYLRVTFLPELGGKIHEVIDKTTGQPMFYVNHVIKPGLIGQCGAWTSGGVEWNTGPQGHTVSCMTPVAVEILSPERDGSRSVAVGETERIYGTHWTVVVTLRPGRAFLEERIRIYNPTETIRPYYFWNCTAAPNTPGFRFIYPMTLGCDHAGEKFFNWPVDLGKDLTRGTNYADASSIFAWHCDQDFFGSYNDDLGRGVVAYANHHQVPGKKAWTWGQGGFGKMHQMDLTDTDGPYNEVQTGPLLTQAQVGRLDPCEAVEWREWWYPVHGLGGFTFANRDVAVNASRQGASLTLSLLGTAEWKGVEVCVSAKTNPGAAMMKQSCRLSPQQPSILSFQLPESSRASEQLAVRVLAGGTRLAEFWVPMKYPRRTAPEKKAAPASAGELAESGWQEFLFGKFTEAEGQFQKALRMEAKCAEAKIGLAFLKLDAEPGAAAESARAALELEPDSGLGHYALAVAYDRAEPSRSEEALAEAWKASLSPVTAVAGRVLVAKLCLRRPGGGEEVINALAASGPWQSDPLSRNRLALALLNGGDRKGAIRLARESLAVDPLDAFARSVLWFAKAEADGLRLDSLVEQNPHTLLDVVAEHASLVGENRERVERLLRHFYGPTPAPRESLVDYWAMDANVVAAWPTLGKGASSRQDLAVGEFPFHREALPILRQALERNPKDGRAALYLGHLLFHLGRLTEGKGMWERAAQLGFEPVVAYRALGWQPRPARMT